MFFWVDFRESTITSALLSPFLLFSRPESSHTTQALLELEFTSLVLVGDEDTSRK